MIHNKKDLLYYMEEDRKAFHKPKSYSFKKKIANLLFRDGNFEYMKCLGRLEYYANTGGYCSIITPIN